MKKLLITLTLGIFLLGTSAATFAQHRGAEEDFVKSLTETFNYEDYFTTVDEDENFEKRFWIGCVRPRVFRWYYRPVVVRPVVWRPAFFRPVIVYHRYWVPVYHTHFTWTTITTSTTFHKSANDTNGAMLDSNPAPGTPLAELGLRRGDIITHIDGRSLQSLQDLNRATVDSEVRFMRGNETRFAGNLLKNANDNFLKSFEVAGMQEVEAGTLMTNAQIQANDLDMYKYFDANPVLAHQNKRVFGVAAADNNGNGVRVTQVLANEPGDIAGFEVNDIILEINGVRITSEQGYSDAIDRAGRFARMVVRCGRTGNTVHANVELNK